MDYKDKILEKAQEFVNNNPTSLIEIRYDDTKQEGIFNIISNENSKKLDETLNNIDFELSSEFINYLTLININDEEFNFAGQRINLFFGNKLDILLIHRFLLKSNKSNQRYLKFNIDNIIENTFNVISRFNIKEGIDNSLENIIKTKNYLVESNYKNSTYIPENSIYRSKTSKDYTYNDDYQTEKNYSSEDEFENVA